MKDVEKQDPGLPSTRTEHENQTLQGVAIKNLEDTREPSLDPRISNGAPTPVLSTELANNGHGHDSEKKAAEIVEFELDDPRNPVNFPYPKKWRITLLSCFATMIAAYNAGAYNMGFASMTRDLNATTFQATIGLSLYALGFGLFPMVTASFSEEVGRLPIYVVSAFGVLLMYVMVALAPNIQTVLVARFLQGGFGSTWATNVGGTIADIWMPHERGLPMSIFAFAALGGTGFGPLIGGWIEINPRLGWKWIEWIEMMICAIYPILVPFMLRETRSSIILTRVAKRIRKETGDNRYRARIEDERASLRTLIYISCTRPIYLLLTEPVITSFSLWIGFAWGVLYCMVESISLVFSSTYDFNIGQTGSIFSTMLVGSVLGMSTNFIQERLYRKYYSTRGPEARLYFACVAAIAFPVGMFIYAWTSFSRIPWIAPAIGIAFFIWATFVIYLAVFTYLADCYGPFASSALAGQSLCRNLAATAFPLFTRQMFDRLSYKWANTLFGCIAVVMMPIPFILFFYGPSIRRRSKFSGMVMDLKKS
ncbi:MFS polyamine transporter [Dendrothele bispora CBS 962.96]|uniref:MFS polyamine transporter n=1 Tax=Dendrothele bispora (strain CBS 962.96) TaxID=1314807 RepID=A0A4S8L736_DENBC|nr:MFS polyamine transporter [Dendrothele bispora CBS 962.96]